MGVDKDNPVETPDADIVVDAEIVDGEPGKTTASASEPKTVEAVVSQQKTSGKAGWVVAGFLAAFIAGVIAAPYGEQSLRNLGLLAPLATTPSTDDDGASLQQLTELNSRTENLFTAIERHQEILAQHNEQLTQADDERARIESDLALMAARPGTLVDEDSAASQQALRDRVQAVTEDVARLAALSASASPEVAELNGALAIARAETAQLKTSLQSMETVLAGLQAGSLETSPRGRLLLAIGRVKDQVLRGLPFGGEVDALRVDLAVLPALDQQMVGTDIATLTEHPEGISTYEALVRAYGPMASAVKREQEKQDGSLLASLFTVRRTDEDATGIDAALLSAERKLVARDVAGALTELSSLTGEAEAAATAWKAEAGAFVQVSGAIDRLQRVVARSNTGDAG